MGLIKKYQASHRSMNVENLRDRISATVFRGQFKYSSEPFCEFFCIKGATIHNRKVTSCIDISAPIEKVSSYIRKIIQGYH